MIMIPTTTPPGTDGQSDERALFETEVAYRGPGRLSLQTAAEYPGQPESEQPFKTERTRAAWWAWQARAAIAAASAPVQGEPKSGTPEGRIKELETLVRAGQAELEAMDKDMEKLRAAPLQVSGASEWQLYANEFEVEPENIDYDGEHWTAFIAGVKAGRTTPNAPVAAPDEQKRVDLSVPDIVIWDWVKRHNLWSMAPATEWRTIFESVAKPAADAVSDNTVYEWVHRYRLFSTNEGNYNWRIPFEDAALLLAPPSPDQPTGENK
jgi:hypothetical protein